jgi:hypothetical protein
MVSLAVPPLPSFTVTVTGTAPGAPGSEHRLAIGGVGEGAGGRLQR